MPTQKGGSVRGLRFAPGLPQHSQPISETDLLNERLVVTAGTHDRDQTRQSGRVTQSGRDRGAVEIGPKTDAILTDMFEQVLEVLDDQVDRGIGVLTTVRAKKTGGE